MSHIRSKSFVVALAAASALAGCGSREHINPRHGEATREWRHRQRVHSDVAAGKPGGLDSEEAALIHARYRQSLGPTSGATQEPASRVLILDEGGGGRRAASKSSNK